MEGELQRVDPGAAASIPREQGEGDDKRAMELKPSAFSEYALHRYPSVKVPGDVDLAKVQEVFCPALVAKSTANDITIPDPTPQWVRDDFYDLTSRLGPILEKDSVRSFLRLFINKPGMSWDRAITAQTLTYMVSYDSLQCAEVALEGKVPQLNGHRANPNCINPYGYFPLHEAAERFSVDMIKLLFNHGASANVRTIGADIIEDLLPLHVAVENTCLHKYLEDNVYPIQNHPNYIYKLIHLLCLPEMKIFLDTIRLLATKTDNLVDELWKYMEDGKLIQSAVLLLAAEEQIRGGCSSKINGNDKQDGFSILMHRIVRRSIALRWEKRQIGVSRKQLEEKRALMDSTGLLIDIIYQAGEVLSAYIKTHSEVSHVNVLDRVSSILEESGFPTTRESIDANNLRPYDCKTSGNELRRTGHVDAAKAITETANGHDAKGKTENMKLPKGWDPTYMKRSFFPYWRSVLQSQFPVKVYPLYAATDVSVPDFKLFDISPSTSSSSTPIPNHKMSLLGRAPQLASDLQSRRLYAAASKLLKVLKNA